MKSACVQKDEMYHQAMNLYMKYKCGTLSCHQYLRLIKPIDMEITKIEMSILQDKLVESVKLTVKTPVNRFI